VPAQVLHEGERALIWHCGREIPSTKIGNGKRGCPLRFPAAQRPGGDPCTPRNFPHPSPASRISISR
jgi:hypothetical protein